LNDSLYARIKGLGGSHHARGRHLDPRVKDAHLAHGAAKVSVGDLGMNLPEIYICNVIKYV
jgi:hypothetical protein